MDVIPIEIKSIILLYVIHGTNSGKKFFLLQPVCHHWFELLINIVNDNNIYLAFNNSRITTLSLNRLNKINNIDFINCPKLSYRFTVFRLLHNVKAIDL